jgi:hypothetical protein
VALREARRAERGEFPLNGPFSTGSGRQAQSRRHASGNRAAERRRTTMFSRFNSMSLAAALAAASLLNMSGEAAAALQCGKHDDVAKVLTAKFKETRRVMGVVNSTAVMEIFMSPQGTWTMLVTGTNGTSCITASGEEWQDVPVEVAGLES